jgi:hypothetical protein
VAQHTGYVAQSPGSVTAKIGTGASTAAAASHDHVLDDMDHTVTQPSNHSALSVVQPYIVVYFWKRTA